MTEQNPDACCVGIECPNGHSVKEAKRWAALQVKRSQGCRSSYGLNPEVGSNIPFDKTTTR